MLALLGDHTRFNNGVRWLGKNLRFDKVTHVCPPFVAKATSCYYRPRVFIEVSKVLRI